MDQYYKKYEEDRKATELENTKLKLKMVSKNSKTSKPSVDDYINNILGSGLKFNKPTHYNKFESQSVRNIPNNDTMHSVNHFNQSCYFHAQINNGDASHKELRSSLPSLYDDVIDTVSLSKSELDTHKIYEIFLTSGLSKEVLGTIWSLINRTQPGKLTKEELIAGLAMIALCQEQSQNHVSVTLPTWEQVVSLSILPVPRIVIKEFNHTTESNHNSTYQCKVQGLDSGPIKLDLFDSKDEWADFSDFVPHEINSVLPKESIVSTLDPHSDDLNLQAPVSSKITEPTVDLVLDFREEVENIFYKSGINETFTSTKPCGEKDGLPNGKINLLHERFDNKSLAISRTPADTDFGDFQLFSCEMPISMFDESETSSRRTQVDRYELFNCDIKGPCDNLIEQWLRCLTQSLKILSNTVSVLKQVEDEQVKVDVFNTDKGILLLKGIIEVYRVTRNIKLSASRSSILTTSKPMLDQLSDLERYWTEFMMVIPDEMQIGVQSMLSRGGPLESTIDGSSDELSSLNACGVCLCRLDNDDGFLSHGLHRYHCPCANLWVNTLDLTLPGLSALNLTPDFSNCDRL